MGHSVPCDLISYVTHSEGGVPVEYRGLMKLTREVELTVHVAEPIILEAPDMERVEGFPWANDEPTGSDGNGTEPAPPALGHVLLQLYEKAPSSTRVGDPPP